MLKRVVAGTLRILTTTPKYGYLPSPKHSETHHHVLLPSASPASLASWNRRMSAAGGVRFRQVNW